MQKRAFLEISYFGMVKTGKKKEKKLKKKLQKKTLGEDTPKLKGETKAESTELKKEPSEDFDRISEIAYQNIEELMREKSAPEERLDEIAEPLKLSEEDKEKLPGSEYAQGSEYSKKYGKYKAKEPEAYATDKQPGFAPINPAEQDEDKKYHRAKKTTETSSY